MSKNKFCILLCVILFLTNTAISYAVTVQDLYPAAKVYNAATETYTVPALLRAVGATAVANETVALSLTKAIAGGLVTSLAIAGAGYLGNAYIDWLMGNTPAMYYDTDTVLKYNTHSYTYSPTQAAIDDMITYEATCCSKPCSGAAPNVAIIDGYSFTSNAHTAYPDLHTSGSRYFGGCLFTLAIYKVDAGYCQGMTRHYWITAVNNACLGQNDIVTKNPVTENYLNPLNEAAINGGTAAVVTAAATAIDKSQTLIGGGAGAAAVAGTLPKVLHDKLLTGADSNKIAAMDSGVASVTPDQYAANVANQNAAALTAAQLAAALASAGLTAAQIAAAVGAVESANGLTASGIAAAIAAALAGTGATPAQIQAATTAALSAAGLTAAGIAAAIAAANPAQTQAQTQAALEAALAAKLGADVANPTDPTITPPTKLNLTTVMGSFMTTINALPMMNTLHGLGINISGATSLLCINLPSNLGGTKCFDCAAFSGVLALIGSAMLGLTTLFSFMYIFKG